MGAVMWSIGEIPHATGVSRRTLRHRETVGLIAPAVVDDVTGYRRYAHSLFGKVRAIAALRSTDDLVALPRLTILMRRGTIGPGQRQDPLAGRPRKALSKASATTRSACFYIVPRALLCT